MYLKSIGILLISSLFIGCVSIPPEAPQLSTELGKRITAIETANIKLLNKFFEQKRKEVDKFIVDEWTPLFSQKLFSNPQVSKLWDTIVRENNKQDRLMFLIKFGPKLQTKINEKRLELILPLEQLERSIENQIRQEYAQAKAINNSISSLLLSAVEVTKNTDRYLSMVGITNEKIGSIIDQTDDMVSDLLSKAQDAPNKVDKAKAFIQKVKSLKEKI